MTDDEKKRLAEKLYAEIQDALLCRGDGHISLGECEDCDKHCVLFSPDDILKIINGEIMDN